MSYVRRNELALASGIPHDAHIDFWHFLLLRELVRIHNRVLLVFAHKGDSGIEVDDRHLHVANPFLRDFLRIIVEVEADHDLVPSGFDLDRHHNVVFGVLINLIVIVSII